MKTSSAYVTALSVKYHLRTDKYTSIIASHREMNGWILATSAFNVIHIAKVGITLVTVMLALTSPLNLLVASSEFNAAAFGICQGSSGRPYKYRLQLQLGLHQLLRVSVSPTWPSLSRTSPSLSPTSLQLTFAILLHNQPLRPANKPSTMNDRRPKTSRCKSSG